MKNKILNFIKTLKIIWKIKPSYVIVYSIKVIVEVAISLSIIYFPKLIIESLINKEPSKDLVKIILLYGSVFLFLNLVKQTCTNLIEKISKAFEIGIKKNIGSTCMEMTYCDLENFETQKNVKVLNNSKDFCKIIDSGFYLIKNIITIISYLIILSNLGVKVLGIIVLFSTVKLLFTYLKIRDANNVKKANMENSVYVEYLFNLSYYYFGAAKEIRNNSLNNWYLNKTQKYRSRMVKLNIHSMKFSSLFDIIFKVLFAIQCTVILVILIDLYLGALITIADISLYFSTLNGYNSSLNDTSNYISNLIIKLFNINDLSNLNSLLNKKNDKKIEISKNNNFNKFDIEFKNVSFTYPNTQNEILHNVSFHILDKEICSFVGLNGAGKTTIIKLLCKFYKPSSGNIYIDGVDIWNIDDAEYYKYISSVFQDFINLPFTIMDNINLVENEVNIDEVCEKLKMKNKIDNLPNGYNTYLSKIFDDNGINLSGGENQKLAIIRAIKKDPSILILDEPTANLDPKMESELYKDFLDIAEEKTTIIISHRLAISTLVNKIYVFKDGKLIEQGSHEALMKNRNLYFSMFVTQSKNYLREKN